MFRLTAACGVLACCLAAAAPARATDVTYDQSWTYNNQKDYYYKKCTFPHGGYQYVCYYPDKPSWVYWYNPDKQVYWCACPTVKNTYWGADVKKGKDLFLYAGTPAKSIKDCDFPDPGNDGGNFHLGKTKDKDGSDVELGCPPPDLPPDLP